MPEQQDEKSIESSELKKEDKFISKSPLVFISHDSRDAELAEYFSKLLSSVSAGVLKSFRSSDRKGTQGIEYGIEWYPEIIKKIDEATDVVCLLTKNSVNRPWILYEAGMAKGKLNTTLLGIAIGVPLSQANYGPFAQFQNCASDEGSLSKLVMQLVKRIPNSEPDIDVIKAQVNMFITQANEFISKNEEEMAGDEKAEVQESSIANLFEEIKLMYSELPLKINKSLRIPARKINFNRLSPPMLDELRHYSTKFNRYSGLLIVLSLFKDDFPWISEIGYELLKTIKSRSTFNEKKKAYYEFREVLDFTFEHPLMRDIYFSAHSHYSAKENYRIIIGYLERWFEPELAKLSEEEKLMGKLIGDSQ
ncbi:MAG: toll/interleukin-1 receptor domain-containing protein [Syntrophomonas sp.]